ncbi:MAG: hypothetical protein HY394_01415 [Candidatus Diapherotrites archaeon]|nr:hypothetical protein [Candidatus Diapherotrites archaeon]
MPQKKATQAKKEAKSDAPAKPGSTFKKATIVFLVAAVILAVVLGYLAYANIQKNIENEMNEIRLQAERDSKNSTVTVTEKPTASQAETSAGAGKPEESAQLSEETDSAKTAKAIEVAATNATYQAYVKDQGFDAKVYVLTIEKKEILKQQFIIYQNLPDKELHLVEFSSAAKGSFIAIVDIETGKVEKFFRMVGISA